MVNSAPTNRNGQAEPLLLLNEVAMNYGANSFIELYAPNGFAGNLFNRHHFGLINIMTQRGKKKNYITSIIDLKDLRNSVQTTPTTSSDSSAISTTPRPVEKFLLVGTPTAESLEGSEGHFRSISMVPDPSKIKIFGKPEKWLDIEHDDVRMVILTYSPFESILSKLDWNPGSSNVNHVNLEDQPDLIQYIGSFQADAIVTRGLKGSRIKCQIIEDYILSEFSDPKDERLKPFLTVNDATNDKSISKCGHSDLPFYHKAFIPASLTPGRSNHCIGDKKDINVHLASITNMEPSSTSIGDSCGISDDVFDEVTGEQMNIQIVHSTISVPSANPVCPPRHKTKHAMSEDSNDIHESNAKRIKLMSSLTNSCPDNPFNNDPNLMLPFQRDRRLETINAIRFISKYLPHKFGRLKDIEDYALDWFQIIRNYDDPELSKFNCYYCAKYSADYRIRNNSPLARKEGFIGPKDINHNQLRDHSKSAAHVDVVQKYTTNLKRTLSTVMETDLARLEPAQFEVTNNHMRAVFWLVKQGYSFNGFEGLIGLQERSKGQMGRLCRTDTSAKAMATTISTVYHDEMIVSLSIGESPLTLIVDGVYICICAMLN